MKLSLFSILGFSLFSVPGDAFQQTTQPISRVNSISSNHPLTFQPLYRRNLIHQDKCNSCIRLFASTATIDKDDALPRQSPTIIKSFFSASMLLVLDVVFRRLFQQFAIPFPSSLAGCMALFVTLLSLPAGEAIFQVLSPGAALLAKWLPVFFVPSLITLPLAGNIGTAIEVLKILGVIVGGFYFTLLSTAGSVVGIRKLVSPDIDVGIGEDVDQEEDGDDGDENLKSSSKVAPPPPPKPFSDDLYNGLRMTTIGTGLIALLTSKLTYNNSLSGPFSSIFMLSATLYNFVFGARLPKSFTKVVHPLVTCTTLTWTIAKVFAFLTGSTFSSILRTYKTGSLGLMTAGAGDVLLFLLGPAVVSLAISMYDRRKLMKENLMEVGTAVSVSSIGGLFGTAAIVRLLQIANPSLRLSLLSRNITSPLAMAIAGMLGANVSLAVSMVVVTGLIGANFGARILDAFGIQDAVARGLGIGAAAHGLGTAAFVNEKDAFPFAAIAMALTATACTVLVSVPTIKRLLIQMALGV